jgi:RNA polymerase sigma-32 factor
MAHLPTLPTEASVLNPRESETLPALLDHSLSHYLRAIKAFPSLEIEEERDLALRYSQNGDLEAAHRLVTSHLKLVPKIAMRFRGYGLPMIDLISEGNLGLMHAVRKFNPELGYRLSTYALWWIKAAIQDFVIRSWSLVKIGTTSAQKKLFFNLRKMRQRIEAAESRSLGPQDVSRLAEALSVSEKDIEDMQQRLVYGGDLSLDDPIGHDEERPLHGIELLESPDPSQETLLVEKEAMRRDHQLLSDALAHLSDIERSVIQKRKMTEPPVTLKRLAEEFGRSAERIRQIEEAALKKMKLYMTTHREE